MLLELQQSLARQWLDMAEANVRFATDLGFGAARAATQAWDGMGASAPSRSLPMLSPLAWAWPGSGGGLPSSVMGWPLGPAAMSPSAWMGPLSLAAMAWPMLGAMASPAIGTRPQAAAPAMPAFPMLGFPMPGFPTVGFTGFTLPASARSSPSPMAQATADFNDAMLAAYRSATGFAAAMLVLAQPPSPEPRKAEPAADDNPWLAMWDLWLPRR